MINQTRRTLLKGLTAVAAVPVLGTQAVLAVGAPVTNSMTLAGSALPVCDLTIYQHQTGTRETVTLMNLTGKPVTLNEITPVGLSDIHGSLQVTVNLKQNGAKVVLKPGQRLSFDIEATTAHAGPNTFEQSVPNVVAGHVRIKSDHTAFNGIIPVTVFDAQQA